MTTISSVSDAAYHTVHDYPGGAPSLAPRIGISSHRVLDGKVKPTDEYHKLTLDEACKIIALTGDLRILRAMAEENRQLLVPMVDCMVSDAALLDTYTNLMKELGEFSGSFHDALSDGRITRAEFERMQKEMNDFFMAGNELLNRAEQLIDD